MLWLPRFGPGSITPHQRGSSPLCNRRQAHARPPVPPARPGQHSTSSGLAQPPNCLVGSELQACGRECTHVSVPF